MTFSAADATFMREALDLAATVRLSARPNPAVGCVIVAGDRVVGRGATQPPGGHHAEVVALAQAGPEACGAEVFVSLEPCAHFGRTPPCTDALIAAKVARVTFAVIDPNPANRGAGAAALTSAGIAVRQGLLAAEATALNQGFFTRMQHGRPHVVCKLALSLDGAPAMASGESQWITGPPARAAGRALRAAADALITGIGTVLRDDPLLTARDEAGTAFARQPLRVVLDSRARLRREARLFTEPSPVLQLTTRPSVSEHSAECIAVAADDHGRVSLPAALCELARRDISDVLLESGPTLAGAFAAAGLVDEYRLFLAPRLLGSATERALKTPTWTRLADGQSLEIVDVTVVGADLAVHARVRRDS